MYVVKRYFIRDFFVFGMYFVVIEDNIWFLEEKWLVCSLFFIGFFFFMGYESLVLVKIRDVVDLGMYEY